MILFGISIDDLLDENYEVVLPEKTKKKRISREKKLEIEAEIVKEKVESVEEPAFVVAPVEEKIEKEPEQEEIKEEIVTEKKKGFLGRLFGRK